MHHELHVLHDGTLIFHLNSQVFQVSNPFVRVVFLVDKSRVRKFPLHCQKGGRTFCAAHVSQQFANCWLARYPWPRKCVHDNGGEFTGWEFQQLLEQCGIQDAPTTSRNPQANAICERMHQTMGNVLRTLIHGQHLEVQQDADTIVDNSLATTMHVLQSSVSRSLNNHLPGSLSFHRDMFLNLLPLQADLEAIRQRRQLLIDENLRRQNAKRRHYDYQVGQQVLVKDPDGKKLDSKSKGPYIVQQVHANGTLTIQRAPFVTERIHLRQVFPFRAQ